MDFYEKILNEIKEEETKTKQANLFCKLEIYYNAKDFEEFQELEEKEKEKLIDFIYAFYIENDLIENTIFDLCDLIFNSFYYGKNEILQNINALTYQEFENILNEKI